MGFIKVPLDDIKEPKAVPEGEYDLRILTAEDKESKKGSSMTVIRIAIDGHEDAMPITHYIVYPDENTPKEQLNFRLLDIKRFLAAFDVAFENGGFNTEDLPGQTARCMVIQEENEGVMYNRLRLPKLKE